MKIILDMPDDTKCMFVDFVYGDNISTVMQSNSFGSDKLYNGSELTITHAKIEQERESK